MEEIGGDDIVPLLPGVEDNIHSHGPGQLLEIQVVLCRRKMSCNNKWCRIALVTVVVMILITLITIFEEDLGYVMPELPESLASLPLIAQGKNTTTPSACTCFRRVWRDSSVTNAYLNLSLPWLNHTTTLQQLRQQHPNLPTDLLFGGEDKRCTLLPTIFSIDWRNKHWQRATLSPNTDFFLYSGFFDPYGKSSIKLLGVSTSRYPAFGWCNVWYSSAKPPRPVRVATIDYLDYQARSSSRQMPFLVTCPLPPNTTDVPAAVSLTDQPCGKATNLLKVIGARERGVTAYQNRKLPDNPTTMVKGWVPAVCGPALYYYHEDFSLRLVEWLELLRAQAFGQVFLYITDVHPNISKVLQHYVEEGFVQVTDYTYPPPYLNEPSLRRLWTLVERGRMFAQENIYFTDCVLRHMHQYRFLVHIDPDEVPVLVKHHNFTHLLDDLVQSQKGSLPPGYRLQWSFFYDNLEPSKEAALLPEYLWAMRHTQRSKEHLANPNEGKCKPIYDMNSVRGVFSHGTFLCTGGRCQASKMKRVPPTTAYLGHFKLTCDEECKKGTIHDSTLQKYEKQIGSRVTTVLSKLQLV